MKQKYSLTIGIPVHNEEGNISNLLSSILRQTSKNYTLEKILIVDDGSDDNTVNIVMPLAKKHKQIAVITDGKRLGKLQRLNQIYKKNKSDIVMTFDGDILIGSKNAIDIVVDKFHDPKVGLVSFNDMPVKAQTWTQKITNAHYMIWYEIRKDFNKGDTIYNVHGNAQAIRADLAKKVEYPRNITADQDFLYITTLMHRKNFVHAKKALVYFRTASSLSEHLFQSTRFLHEKDGIKEYFGNWTQYVYYIPMKNKVIGVLRKIAQDPFFATAALLVTMWLTLLSEPVDMLNKKGMWNQIESTKQAITL